jgi:hypothetical protein
LKTGPVLNLYGYMENRRCGTFKTMNTSRPKQCVWAAFYILDNIFLSLYTYIYSETLGPWGLRAFFYTPRRCAAIHGYDTGFTYIVNKRGGQRVFGRPAGLACAVL